jgi:hypothetical protein
MFKFRNDVFASDIPFPSGAWRPGFHRARAGTAISGISDYKFK